MYVNFSKYLNVLFVSASSCTLNRPDTEAEWFDISPRVYAYLHGNIYKQLEVYISTWKEN